VKSVTAKATRNSRSRPGNAGLGIGGDMAGRIARGEVRLYEFAAPDKKRPVLVLTATALCSIYLLSPSRPSLQRFAAYHRKSSERGRRHEVPVRGELAQCGNGIATARGKRVAQLSAPRMNEVCAALRFCLGCDSN